MIGAILFVRFDNGQMINAFSEQNLKDAIRGTRN